MAAVADDLDKQEEAALGYAPDHADFAEAEAEYRSLLKDIKAAVSGDNLGAFSTAPSTYVPAKTENSNKDADGGGAGSGGGGGRGDRKRGGRGRGGQDDADGDRKHARGDQSLNGWILNNSSGKVCPPRVDGIEVCWDNAFVFHTCPGNCGRDHRSFERLPNAAQTTLTTWEGRTNSATLLKSERERSTFKGRHNRNQGRS